MTRATQLKVELTTRGILEVYDRAALLAAAETCRMEHPLVPNGQSPGVFVVAPVSVEDVTAQFAIERLIRCGHSLDSLPGMRSKLGNFSAELTPWPPWPVAEDADDDPDGSAGDREPRYPGPAAGGTAAVVETAVASSSNDGESAPVIDHPLF